MVYEKTEYNNLLERLDSKYMVVLDEVAKEYPYSVAKIKDELASNLFYMDLTYGCVVSLVTYLDSDVINMHTISLIFDPNISMYRNSTLEPTEPTFSSTTTNV